MPTASAPPCGEATELAGLAALLRRSGAVVECDVSGGSMSSAVPDGATVRIRCGGALNAPVGTVVAVLIAGALSVHRLVHRGRSARARGWVVTEGDANLTCDSPLRDDDVLGIVESVRDPEASDSPGRSAVWREVGLPRWRPRRTRLAAPLVSTLVRKLVCIALELDPRLARWTKGLVVLAMVPFVWWRPYPADRLRVASVSHRAGT